VTSAILLRASRHSASRASSADHGRQQRAEVHRLLEHVDRAALHRPDTAHHVRRAADQYDGQLLSRALRPLQELEPQSVARPEPEHHAVRRPLLELLQDRRAVLEHLHLDGRRPE
jgi:hypothetical protein